MQRCRGGAALVVSAVVFTACGAAGVETQSPTSEGLVPIGAGLEGPAGSTASVYAEGLEHASAFAFDTDGRLWIATAAYEDEGDDAVYVVPAAGATPVKVITDVHTPLGLLWSDGALYVSSSERVDAYRDFDGTRFVQSTTVVTFPTGVGENNALALSPDGRIVLGISAPCDACDPESEFSGAVVSFLPDGSDLRVDARDIRAPVGLTYAPGTDDLYVTMNQRDDLGDATPGDWLAIVEPGTAWGFPDCYGQDAAACAGVPQPVAELDPHGAAGDVAIIAGGFGAVTGDIAVVAEWAGRALVQVPLDTSDPKVPATAAPFVTGLENPMAVVVGPDGALYAGDWSTGAIYRVAPA